MAIHAPITGAPTCATIIPFPNRGGSGFRHRGKLHPGDATNLCMPKKKPAPALVRVEEAYSVAMILADALLAQLTPTQRRAAQNAVHRFHCEFDTNDSRAASAFMAGVR